jgi:hypothetical protein
MNWFSSDGKAWDLGPARWLQAYHLRNDVTEAQELEREREE